MEKQTIILVHGWSVTNTDTYGELPARLETEAKLGNAPEVDVRHIYLSKYISFNDSVLLPDLAHAFEAALHRELPTLLNEGKKFIAITHSTGGPVLRYWWQTLYAKQERACPMSHLIMLAPANFGSALAQLGKSRLGRIASWFNGVEPGTGVLDWLELGSESSWQLNHDWICSTTDPAKQNDPVFQFVLSGQTIDHKLYDHVNHYTAETGSDGVIRLASANLNSQYICLAQDKANQQLTVKQHQTSPATAFAIVPGVSHSGAEHGILRSIKKTHDNHPTVNLILACMIVKDAQSYEKIVNLFNAQNETIQQLERVNVIESKTFPDRYMIQDQDSMIMFRLRDNYGHIINDYAIRLTAKDHSPSALAPGFFIDRQKNAKQNGALTYYVNYDVMNGCPAIVYHDKAIRPELHSMQMFGLNVIAQPDNGLVHYQPADLMANQNYLREFIKPNQTTMIDIVMNRVLESELFTLTTEQTPRSFK
ncbi:MAG: phospholipase [Legionellaceae bacterium]|nr:phospholipase [Legionellaceae bacterium]